MFMMTIKRQKNEKRDERDNRLGLPATVLLKALFYVIDANLEHTKESETAKLDEKAQCVFFFPLRIYLKFSPPSAIAYCSPSLSPETKFFKWLTSNTCHSSSSVCLLNGSRFSRRLPENNTGSCGEKFLKLLNA